MECSKCHKIKDFSEFSFKKIDEQIYYLYCDECRNKTIEEQRKYKEKAYEEYNMRKINNIMIKNMKQFFIELSINSYSFFYLFYQLNIK